MVLYDDNIAVKANKTGKKEIRNIEKESILQYVNAPEKITAVEKISVSADLNVGHSSKILRDIKDPNILIIGY